MGKYAYVNGNYVYHRDGYVHFDDRGYQFGDGIYEVVTYIDGNPVDADGHWSRLERSLAEMQIPMPFSRKVLEMHVSRLVRKNKVRNGMVYVQITRGVAPRNHVFPTHPIAPAVLMTTKTISNLKNHKKFKEGVSVMTAPDMRHARRDIKTINLLANCLAKQAAAEKGCYEVIQHQDGFVTEGGSSNFWIIKDKKLITHPVTYDILCGITRQTIRSVAKANNFEVEERPFTIEEALNADEAFVSSASSIVTPVVKIDDTDLGTGEVGDVCKVLLNLVWDYCDDVSQQNNKFTPATHFRG